MAGDVVETLRPRVMMRAHLIAPDDPEWTGVLSTIRHDVYHLPGFVEFAARWQEPGTPMAFVASEGDSVFFVPLIIRAIPPDLAGDEQWFDASCPRGYPGPIAGPQAPVQDDVFVARAIGALGDVLREWRIVSAFVRCHPLLSPSLDLLRGGGAIVEHGESVSIDLANTPAEAWGAIRENHRRAIVHARMNGYAMRVDESWARLDDFLVIHALAMDAHGAAAHWRIRRDYVMDLRTAVTPQLHLCVVEKDGELAAAALITEVDGIAEYHLAATAADHVWASPTKLLIEEVGRWARDRGNRVFHLAGSLRHDDGLVHFKRGFSPWRHPVASWRLVADPGAYERLVDRRQEQAGPTAGRVGAGPDFFPEYRRPNSQAATANEPG